MCDNIMRSTFNSRDIQIKAKKRFGVFNKKRNWNSFYEMKTKWNANWVSRGFVCINRRAMFYSNRSLLKIFREWKEIQVLVQKTRTVPYTARLLLNTIGHLLSDHHPKWFYLYRLFLFFLPRSFHNNEFSVVGKVVEKTKYYNFPIVLSAFAKNLYRERFMQIEFRKKGWLRSEGRDLWQSAFHRVRITAISNIVFGYQRKSLCLLMQICVALTVTLTL